MADDELIALARMIARNSNLINLMAFQLADQACLILPRLEACGRCNLRPITVEHRLMGLQACDRCASELIVTSGRAYIDAYIANPDDPLNEARAALMIEEGWVDLPEAQKIRRLVDYVTIIKQAEGDITVH